jgi:hypothetical protein
MAGDEFPQVMSALAKFSEDTNKLLVMGTHESGKLHVLQGKTQALVQVMEALIDAPERLKQFDESK